MSWAQDEFGTVDLDDERLNDRAVLRLNAWRPSQARASPMPAEAGPRPRPPTVS